MPATTSHEHWSYPLLNDPAAPSAIQTLATAMDTSLTRVNTDRQAALRRPAVSVVHTSTATAVTATVGTNACMTFATVDFDTAGTTNLATYADRITLPAYACVVRVEATLTHSVISTGTVTSVEIGVERALTTAVLVRRYQLSNSRMRVAGLVKCAASERLRLRLVVTGASGGSVSFTEGRLTAAVICRTS